MRGRTLNGQQTGRRFALNRADLEVVMRHDTPQRLARHLDNFFCKATSGFSSFQDAAAQDGNMSAAETFLRARSRAFVAANSIPILSEKMSRQAIPENVESMAAMVGTLDPLVAAEFLITLSGGRFGSLARPETLSSLQSMDTYIASALLYEIRLTGNDVALTDPRIFTKGVQDFLGRLGSEAASEFLYAIGSTGNADALLRPEVIDGRMADIARRNARLAGELFNAIGATNLPGLLTGERFMGFIDSLDPRTGIDYLSALWMLPRMTRRLTSERVMSGLSNGRLDVWKDIARASDATALSQPVTIVANLEEGGHDRGAKLAFQYLLASGANAIYVGDMASPDAILGVAALHSASFIGLSFTGDASAGTAAGLLALMKANGIGNVGVFGGGLLSKRVMASLSAAGMTFFNSGISGEVTAFLSRMPGNNADGLGYAPHSRNNASGSHVYDVQSGSAAMLQPGRTASITSTQPSVPDVQGHAQFSLPYLFGSVFVQDQHTPVRVPYALSTSAIQHGAERVRTNLTRSAMRLTAHPQAHWINSREPESAGISRQESVANHGAMHVLLKAAETSWHLAQKNDATLSSRTLTGSLPCDPQTLQVTDNGGAEHVPIVLADHGFWPEHSGASRLSVRAVTGAAISNGHADTAAQQSLASATPEGAAARFQFDVSIGTIPQAETHSFAPPHAKMFPPFTTTISNNATFDPKAAPESVQAHAVHFPLQCATTAAASPPARSGMEYHGVFAGAGADTAAFVMQVVHRGLPPAIAVSKGAHAQTSNANTDLKIATNEAQATADLHVPERLPLKADFKIAASDAAGGHVQPLRIPQGVLHEGEYGGPSQQQNKIEGEKATHNVTSLRTPRFTIEEWRPVHAVRGIAPNITASMPEESVHGLKHETTPERIAVYTMPAGCTNKSTPSTAVEPPTVCSPALATIVGPVQVRVAVSASAAGSTIRSEVAPRGARSVNDNMPEHIGSEASVIADRAQRLSVHELKWQVRDSVVISAYCGAAILPAHQRLSIPEVIADVQRQSAMIPLVIFIGAALVALSHLL